MTCYFDKNCQASEVLAYYFYHDEKAARYDLNVLCKEKNSPNFVRRGYITLSEDEMHQILQTKSLTSPEELIGRRMQIVSNELCKEAGINHLKTILQPDEWKQIQQAMEKAAMENALSDYTDYDSDGEEIG